MDTSSEINAASEQTPTNLWTASLWFQILLVAALGLGIIFRLAGLGNKIYSHDEAFASLYASGYREGDVKTIWDGRDVTAAEIQNFVRPAAGKDAMDTLSYLAMRAPHQAPLFYVLANPWMRLVGFSPEAMRGLSAIFGLLSIPAMYWFSKELFKSQRVALLSTVFFALSPFYILYSQDARPYSLWTFATLVSSAALLQAMRRQEIEYWLLYSLTLILGVYSQQLFLLVIVVHGCYLAAVYLIHHKKRFGGFFLASLIAFLAYLPWLFFLITRWSIAAPQMEALKMAFPWYRYIQRWMVNFSSPFVDMDLLSGNLIPYVLRAVFLALLGVALLFLVKHGLLEQKLFVLLMYAITAGALIVPDLLGGGIRSVSGRYFIATNIVTIPVIVYFLSNTLDRAEGSSGKKWRILVGLLVTMEIISNVNSLYAETWWNKELSQVRPQFIDEINKEQTILIVSGLYPTNFGDVLLLSLEVNPYVHFRLYEDPEAIEIPNQNKQVYWFPSSYEDVQEISEKKGLQVREVLPGTLWKIE